MSVANTWHLLYRSRKHVALGGLSAQIQVNYQQVDQSPSYGREVTQAPGKTLMGDKSFCGGK